MNLKLWAKERGGGEVERMTFIHVTTFKVVGRIRDSSSPAYRVGYEILNSTT